nr:hypothetical protein L204_05249 [Cryptococcus depauperatus CBS 7855]
MNDKRQNGCVVRALGRPGEEEKRVEENRKKQIKAPQNVETVVYHTYHPHSQTMSRNQEVCPSYGDGTEMRRRTEFSKKAETLTQEILSFLPSCKMQNTQFLSSTNPQFFVSETEWSRIARSGTAAKEIKRNIIDHLWSAAHEYGAREGDALHDVCVEIERKAGLPETLRLKLTYDGLTGDEKSKVIETIYLGEIDDLMTG